MEYQDAPSWMISIFRPFLQRFLSSEAKRFIFKALDSVVSEPGEVKMGGGLEGLRMTFTPQKCCRFHGKKLPTTWAGG